MEPKPLKRIITCSDGTWDRPGNTDGGIVVQSNVELLFNCITNIDPNGIKQLKAYDTGVGSSTFSLKDKISGGATGWGIDKKIKDIYTFLILNYQEGDEIYLFGFSRGAYTARSLAGFIRNCGILKPAHLQLIDRAYELYRDRNDYTSPDSDLMISFRENYCVENITRIKFIGVWDTVGCLGIPIPAFRFYNQERYKFHDETLSSTVDFAYHALAVDERRKLFEPSLWQKSANLNNGQSQVMEQRWFSGVHCNIGGGYVNTKLSDMTLKWMMSKAKNTGLALDFSQLPERMPNPRFTQEIRNSDTLAYRVLNRPVWRQINANGITNEQIDDSVFLRIQAYADYRPQNKSATGASVFRNLQNATDNLLKGPDTGH